MLRKNEIWGPLFYIQCHNLLPIQIIEKGSLSISYLTGCTPVRYFIPTGQAGLTGFVFGLSLFPEEREKTQCRLWRENYDFIVPMGNTSYMGPTLLLGLRPPASLEEG